MRLTAILLLTACITASAGGRAQTISLNEKDASLEKVFKQIKKQSGYYFWYDNTVLQSAKKVTVMVKNATIETVLAICFKDQPLSYEIVDNRIVVVKKKEDKSPNEEGGNEQRIANSEPPPPIDISGRVTNNAGEPLSGASVTIKRTGKGTITNANGEFSLKQVNNDDILVVSYIGYTTLNIKVGERTNFTLLMNTATDKLDEIVLQGYTKTSERLRTGNISTVTAAEIEKQPVINPLQALQGRVAGLDVSQVNGYASAPFRVEIRGKNLIGNAPADPLYIIDGVPLTILEVPQGGSGYATGSTGFIQNPYLQGPAGGQSPFFSINPADIESVTILKDADATAIYGSRGANGVIIITTKKGSVGKTSMNMNVYHGTSVVTRHYNMLNTQQYIAMRLEAIKNDGYTQYLNLPAARNFFYDLVIWDTTRYTDWQKYLWGNMGNTTDAQIDVSGGNKQTNFRIAAGYNHSTDITTVAGGSERGSLNFNFNHKSLNQRLGLSFTNIYSAASTNMINLGSSMVLESPNSPSVYNDQGNLNYRGWDPVSSRLYDLGSVLRPYRSTTYFLNGRINANYEIIKGLVISTNLGYSYASANQKYLTSIASQDPARNPTGTTEIGNNRTVNWIIEPQLQYDRFISKGKLSFLIGGSNQNNTSDGSYITGSGYTNDNLLNSISNAPFKNAFDIYGRYKYAAFFGRLNYDWKDKYIVNISARRDGSSRFGQGKQYGNFGAIGWAWIFSEENLIKNHLRFLSFGKIRGSYGTTGSDIVGDYGYLTRWSGSNVVPYQGNPSYIPLQHANPDYRWQLNKKLEFAVDLNFLNNRISTQVAWYQNRCSNQLVQFPLPMMTGFGSVVANWPANVQNRGIEVNIQSKIIERRKIEWLVRFNISRNRNLLLSYPDISQSPYANSLFVGKSLFLTNVVHYTGVDPQTGKYTYEDQNKDGSISNNLGPTGDTYPLELTPKFFGGFGSHISYQNLQFDFFFNYKKQIGPNAFRNIPPPGSYSNQPVEILDRWQKPGDVATFARYTQNPQASDLLISSSDFSYTDASFIRLSNLAISYDLPMRWMNKLKLSKCSLSIQGQNLFVVTKYKGVDPETRSFGGMPPAKVFTGGIKIIL